MSNKLVMHIEIQGFEEPLFLQATIDGFEEPLFLVDKLGLLETPLQGTLQFQGREGVVVLNTHPK